MICGRPFGESIGVVNVRCDFVTKSMKREDTVYSKCV
jgi:hypothetical protein